MEKINMHKLIKEYKEAECDPERIEVIEAWKDLDGEDSDWQNI